jgi:hypothetical protein
LITTTGQKARKKDAMNNRIQMLQDLIAEETHRDEINQSEAGAIIVQWPTGAKLVFHQGRGGHNSRFTIPKVTSVTTGNSLLAEAIRWAGDQMRG